MIICALPPALFSLSVIYMPFFFLNSTHPSVFLSFYILTSSHTHTRVHPHTLSLPLKSLHIRTHSLTLSEMVGLFVGGNDS